MLSAPGQASTAHAEDILHIAKVVERELSDVRSFELVSVGHLPNLEAPRRFASQLRRFVEAREAPGPR